jgi:hypothetical protein
MSLVFDLSNSYWIYAGDRPHKQARMGTL